MARPELPAAPPMRSDEFRLVRAAFGTVLPATLAEGLPSAVAEEARRSGGEKRLGGCTALLVRPGCRAAGYEAPLTVARRFISQGFDADRGLSMAEERRSLPFDAEHREDAFHLAAVELQVEMAGSDFLRGMP